MGVVNLGTRTEHERGPELRHALAGLLDAIPIPPRPATVTPGAGSYQGERPRASDRSGLRGQGIVVNQHAERDVLVRDERLRVPDISRADGHNIGAPAPNLVIVTTQLRGVGPAVESAEMAKEDEDDGRAIPKVAESHRDPTGIGELELAERSKVHMRSLPRMPPCRAIALPACSHR